MTALHPHRNAYARPDVAARTPRGIEYDVFAQVTNRLHAAREADFPTLAAALGDNLKLWSTLAADVANPANTLPAPLRAQLFYLYEFTEQHSSKLLRREGAIDVLIDINTSVMRGLRGEVGA